MERLRDGMWLLSSHTPSNPVSVAFQRDGELLLTDPGIARLSKGKNAELADLCRRLGTSVGCIVLLHSHPDHIGNIPNVAAGPVPIYTHRKGFWSLRSPQRLLHAERVLSGKRGAQPFFASWQLALFPVYGRLVYGPGMQGYRKGGSEEDGRYIEADGRFACSGFTVEVISLPGHTPGEVGLWEPEERILVHGDLIPNTHVGRDHIPSLYLPEANVYAAQESLKVIQVLRPRLLVPAHGEPIRSEDEIQDRCAKMLDVLNGVIRRVLVLREAHPSWTVEAIAKRVFDHPTFPQTRKFGWIERRTMTLSVLRDRR